MSTRAAIGMEMPNGTVKAIYLHNDGYPAYAGAILAGYYKTPEQVWELIALGEISSLGIGISNEQGTEAYTRDFGDEPVDPKEFRNAETFWKAGLEYFNVEWLYLYQNGKWYSTGRTIKGEIFKVKTIF